jgi:hypothetical protein
MAMTGYYKTFVRPRTHRPLSMIKYDPVGMFCDTTRGVGRGRGIPVEGVGTAADDVLYSQAQRAVP